MTTEPRRTQLIILRHSPYGSGLARTGLDAALAAAAFDQPVQLLFLGDGVLQLLPEQDSTAIGCRNIAKLIASLPLYDIEKVYVDAGALIRYGIAHGDLQGNIEALDADAIHELMSSNTHLLGF